MSWSKVLSERVSFLSCLAIAIVLLFSFLDIKGYCSTSDFERWYAEAKSQCSKNCFWGNDPCPQTVGCLNKALDAWTANDGTKNKLAALSLRADLLKCENKYKEAIEDYTKAIEIDKYDPLLYKDCGRCLMLAKEYDQAIPNFKKAIDLIVGPPVNAKQRMWLQENYNWLGKIYFEKKDFKTADLYFSKAIEEHSVGYYYRDRGRNNNRLGRYDRAVQDFTKAIDHIGCVSGFPQEVSSNYRERGYAYIQLKQYKKAIDDFTEAMRDNSGDRGFDLLERGFAYSKLGQTDKANEDRQQAQKYRRRNPYDESADLPINGNH